MDPITTGIAPSDALSGTEIIPAVPASPTPQAPVVVVEAKEPEKPEPKPTTEPGEPAVKTETKPGELEMSVGDFPQRKSLHVAGTPQAPFVDRDRGIDTDTEAAEVDEQAARRFTGPGMTSWRNAALQLPHEAIAGLHKQQPVVVTTRPAKEG